MLLLVPTEPKVCGTVPVYPVDQSFDRDTPIEGRREPEVLREPPEPPTSSQSLLKPLYPSGLPVSDVWSRILST